MDQPTDPKTTRCTSCEAEFTDAETEGALGCPSCGTQSVPCSIARDVTLNINWHELRILTIWADNWAGAHCDVSGKKSLATIIKRLEAQRPEGYPALTFLGECRELQDEGVDLSVETASGKVILPKRVKN